MSTEGTDLTPTDWPWVVTAGDTLSGETVELYVQAGEDGDEVPFIITEASAVLRERASADSDLVADVPCEFDGNVLTVGKDMEVPDAPGEYVWDDTLTGTVDGVEVGPLTWHAGSWRIRPDLGAAS